MTELREPPLLNDKEIKTIKSELDHRTINPFYDGQMAEDRAIAQAQRESDKKWMKENCYIKAEERELPENPYESPKIDSLYRAVHMGRQVGYDQAQQAMLKEVDGVAYRACEEIKK